MVAVFIKTYILIGDVDHISTILLVLTFIVAAGAYYLALRVTRYKVADIVKSLNLQGDHPATLDKTFLVSTPLSHYTLCLNVYDRLLIVSREYGRGVGPIHYEYKVNETSEINIWRGFMRIMPASEKSRSHRWISRFAGDSQFSTNSVQHADNLKILGAVLNSKNVLEDLKKELVKAGFKVGSSKPNRPLARWLLVVIVLLLAFVIIGFKMTADLMNKQ